MQGFDGIELQRSSTAEQLAAALTEKILSGEIRPGEALRESAIASSLTISRNTVREAVRLLEQGGLVDYEFNRGTVVIEPSVDELAELFRVRLSLESAAVSRLPSEAGLRRVQDAFDGFREAAEQGAAELIVRADLAFHASIVSLLESKRIDAFYAQILQELKFYLMVLSTEDREHERAEELIADHRRILDALESPKPGLATAVVEAHIAANQERLHSILLARLDPAAAMPRIATP